MPISNPEVEAGDKTDLKIEKHRNYFSLPSQRWKGVNEVKDPETGNRVRKLRRSVSLNTLESCYYLLRD